MNDFLTLMTAQLQNQDPLNPTDSNQFLSQLSELSTVEGISQLNTSMTHAVELDAVIAGADQCGARRPGHPGPGELGDLHQRSVAERRGAGAHRRHQRGLTISNSAGVVVDQQAVPATSGLQNFSWNGTMSNGQQAPSGSLQRGGQCSRGRGVPDGHHFPQRHGLERHARRQRRQSDAQYRHSLAPWR